MAETQQPSLRAVLISGIKDDNPALRQMLGLCPTLAVTTAITNGLGMGLATTFVLVCSEVVVALLRNLIPKTVRIPAFITIIASFVTLTMMLVAAFLPALNDALGIYLPLIVVNCIVLGRAESFASKKTVLFAAVDGLSMGAGFTLSLVAMSAIRELLGAGTLCGLTVMPSFFEPILIMVTPTGGFAVLALLVAIIAIVDARSGRSSEEPQGPSETLCAACPLNCSLSDPSHLDCAIQDEYVQAHLKGRLKRMEEEVSRRLGTRDSEEGDA